MKVIKVRAVKRREKEIYIDTDFIKLDSALKLCDIAQTGGHAKILITEGEIFVNGEECLQRGKKLRDGDRIEYENLCFIIKKR